MQMSKSKWFLPAFSVGLGLAFFAAQWIGGDPREGLVSLGIMVVFGALVLVGGARSETIRGLRGDGRDERFKQLDIHATALAGIAVITAILIAFAVEVARGHDGCAVRLARRDRRARLPRRRRRAPAARLAEERLDAGRLGSLRRAQLAPRAVGGILVVAPADAASCRGGTGSPAPCRSAPRPRAPAARAPPRARPCPSGSARRSCQSGSSSTSGSTRAATSARRDRARPRTSRRSRGSPSSR